MHTSPAPDTATGPAALLYVEDEDNDVLFMRRALARANVTVDFHTVCDGDKAVSFLAGEAPYVGRTIPNLVLLDLNLPARSGFEVLDWIRHNPDPALRTLPVVVISSSGRPEDRDRARRLGADDYLIKPTSPLRLVDIADELQNRWLTPVSARPPAPGFTQTAAPSAATAN